MALSWWKPSTPDDLQPIPWLHPSVVSYLDNLIQREWEILEHGSGGSTLWLAERAHRVTSIEVNPQYYDALSKRTPNNACLIKSPPFSGEYNLLLIDGDPVEDRAWYLDHARELVVSGGYVVLDNANRPEYTEARYLLKSTITQPVIFDCNESGTKYLVTEIYRL